MPHRAGCGEPVEFNSRSPNCERGLLKFTSHRFQTTRPGPLAWNGSHRLRVLLLVVTSLGIPAAALADIYQWTDERGKKVLSNVPPTTNDKAKDVKVFVKDDKAAAATPAAAASGSATSSAGRTPASETRPVVAPAPASAPAPALKPAAQEPKSGAANGTESDDRPGRGRKTRRSSE